MISFLLFGRSLSVYLFSGLFYTKNWFPHPLLATSTPKLSGSNSSHGRSTCASEASCWSVDYFSNFFQTLTVFPWNIQASRDSEEDWQTIWRSKTVPHFNFQQEKYPSLQLEPSSHHEPTTPGHCLCHWLLLPSTRCATTTATTQALKKAPTLKGPGSMVETCNKKMRCFVWLFDSFRFLKDKGILVVCDLVAFWFGWFYENLRCVPNQSLDHSMGWQQKYTKMSVLSQCFLWPKKNRVENNDSVFGAYPNCLIIGAGDWCDLVSKIVKPRNGVGLDPIPTPFRFPTCFVVRRAAKQRSLVVGRRIGHPRNGLTLKARHRDLLGQWVLKVTVPYQTHHLFWFSSLDFWTSIKNNKWNPAQAEDWPNSKFPTKSNIFVSGDWCIIRHWNVGPAWNPWLPSSTALPGVEAEKILQKHRFDEIFKKLQTASTCGSSNLRL